MLKKEKHKNVYDHFLCSKAFKLFSIQKELNKQTLKQNKIDFSILLPPPNVTGKLHLGHAWNAVIQDFLIRFHHLILKKKVYWACGFDHAGIATQTKYLKETKNQVDTDTRENKIAGLKQWIQKNIKSIIEQWKSLGLFLDYQKQHFTLSKKANILVRKTFVDLFHKGYIYKAKKLVNWDFQLQTAISDIEVLYQTKKNKLYYVKYYCKNGGFLTVATTRIETIFVDVCLFVNPSDSRYKAFLNQKVINPLTKKLIPIIADEYVDVNFGSGVMKCTPAHDFNDYRLALKHNLKFVSCFNFNQTTNQNALDFANLPINVCKQKVADYLFSNNLLVKVETIESNIGLSQRSGSIVEPMLSYQWFVRVKKISEAIIKEQIKPKKVVFFPPKFQKNLIIWLQNIEDWCISRQLWWGHQIPCWYQKDTKQPLVSFKPPHNQADYFADQDVLDTWFSSGLWPFIVNQKHNLFPTSVLITGFDIIFFWIARMLFFSYYLKKEVPFKHIYITGLIRDQYHRKMSKSLNNGINPKDVISKYGADVLRLFLLASTSSGEDLVYLEKKMQWYWGFLNKIWNCFHYVSTQAQKIKRSDLKFTNLTLSSFDAWILYKFRFLVKKYRIFFKKYQFALGVQSFVNFVWNDFCNIYLEYSKQKNTFTRNVTLTYLILQILILLHPFCPFISNYLYEKLWIKKQKSILHERLKLTKIQKIEVQCIDVTIKSISKIKTFFFAKKVKNEINIVFLQNNINQKEISDIFSAAKLVLSDFDIKQKKPFIVEEFFLVYLNQDQTMYENIQKEINKVKFEIIRAQKLLDNKNFVNKANPQIVASERQKLTYYLQKLEKLEFLAQKN